MMMAQGIWYYLYYLRTMMPEVKFAKVAKQSLFHLILIFSSLIRHVVHIQSNGIFSHNRTHPILSPLC